MGRAALIRAAAVQAIAGTGNGLSAWLPLRPTSPAAPANLRWNGDKLVVVHDWDSVTADSEAVLAGFAAALYSTVAPPPAGIG